MLASVQPDSPLHGLEGLKHMESAIVPGIYDPKLADEDVRVGTEEAYEMTRRLAQEEGLLVGISSGANLAGALKVARKGAVMVVVFCDGGERYLSERFWENPPEGALDRRHELMAIALTAAVDAAIRAHGRETFPHECCGAHARQATASCAKRSRCRTRPKKGRGGDFSCGPMTIASRRSARAKPGSTCSGFYHSHPDHPAQPSQYDLDHAWPSFSYVIVSVMAGEDKLLTSWQLKDDRSAFDEETRRNQRITNNEITNMATKILIPTPLRPFTDKLDAVEIDGATIGELLQNLTTKYGGLKQHLYAADGKLRSFVNIYVNDDDIRYLQKDQTPLKAGDTVSIIPSVAGGAPLR